MTNIIADTAMALAGKMTREEQIIMRLGLTPFRRVSVYFTGSGDSGSIDSIQWGDAQTSTEMIVEYKKNPDEILDQLLEDYVYNHVNWEVNNEGSSGWLYVDLDQDMHGTDSGPGIWSEVEFYYIESETVSEKYF